MVYDVLTSDETETIINNLKSELPGRWFVENLKHIIMSVIKKPFSYIHGYGELIIDSKIDDDIVDYLKETYDICLIEKEYYNINDILKTLIDSKEYNAVKVIINQFIKSFKKE